MFLTLFFTIDSIRYNTKFYDLKADDGGWLTEEFKTAMKAAAKNAGGHEYSAVIKTQDEYDWIFTEKADFEVDLFWEMLVVYMDGFSISRVDIILTGMDVKDRTLRGWYMERFMFGRGTCCNPYTRWFVVKMRTANVTSATFEQFYPFR